MKNYSYTWKAETGRFASIGFGSVDPSKGCKQLPCLRASEAMHFCNQILEILLFILHMKNKETVEIYF